MNDLPLQIAVIDHIIIDQPDAPDTSRRQIQRQWASESARADQQNTSSLETLLAFHPHFRHDEMAAKAPNLVVREFFHSLNDRFHHTLVSNLLYQRGNPRLSLPCRILLRRFRYASRLRISAYRL